MSDAEYLRKKIDEEGDYKAFEYKGYKCRIMRATFKKMTPNWKFSDSNMIFLCGYVGLSKGHKYYGEKDIRIDTDYGIDKAFSSLFLQPEKEFWWVGFDCGHLGDVTDLEDVDKYDISGGLSFYKDMDFVTRQIQNTVDELEKPKAKIKE